MKASLLQRHLAVNHKHKDVEWLLVLRAVCSNNRSPLQAKLPAFLHMLKLLLPASGFCKPSSAGVKSPLVCSNTFLWRHFCMGFKSLCLFSQSKSIVLCSLSQQRIFPALTAAYPSSLFPPLFFIVSWRTVGTDAKCHTLVSISIVPNMQVVSRSYFCLLGLSLFTQRSWPLFLTLPQ